MSDPWWEIHPRGPWTGLLRVYGSWGRTARMAAVAFLKALLDDLPPDLAGRPIGVISVHMPNWVGACLVLDVKIEEGCIRIRCRWPKAGPWQLAAGKPPRRRPPCPTCGGRTPPVRTITPTPKESPPMPPDDDDLAPDFDFATNEDLIRVLRGPREEPAAAETDPPLPADPCRRTDEG